MKNIWAIKNGNWSDPSIWIYNQLPSENDKVFCAGNTIIIDQNIKVETICNEEIYDIKAGGNFVIDNDITIESNIFAKNQILIEYNGLGNLTIIGNISGGESGYLDTIVNNNTGTILVSGSIRGGMGGYTHGINNLQNGTIAVTGFVGMGLGGFSYGIFNSENGTIIINNVVSNLSGYYGKEPWEEMI